MNTSTLEKGALLHPSTSSTVVTFQCQDFIEFYLQGPEIILERQKDRLPWGIGTKQNVTSGEDRTPDLLRSTGGNCKADIITTRLRSLVIG